MKTKWEKFWNLIIIGYTRYEAEKELGLDSKEVDKWFDKLIKFWSRNP